MELTSLLTTLSLLLTWTWWNDCLVHGLIQSEQSDEIYDSSMVVTLYHGFGSGPSVQYTERGTIVVRSSKNNVAVHSNTEPVDPGFKQALKVAVAKGDVYRVRCSTSPDGSGPPWVSGFMAACLLYESLMSDHVALHVSQSGSVMSLSLHTTSTSHCQGHTAVDSDDLDYFNTTVHVMQTKPGPVPETQAYLEKVAQEKAEKERGEQGDNRSFLAKYWMYIVPVVLFVMISGATNPEGQGGGR